MNKRTNETSASAAALEIVTDAQTRSERMQARAAAAVPITFRAWVAIKGTGPKHGTAQEYTISDAKGIKIGFAVKEASGEFSGEYLDGAFAGPERTMADLVEVMLN